MAHSGIYFEVLDGLLLADMVRTPIKTIALRAGPLRAVDAETYCSDLLPLQVERPLGAVDANKACRYAVPGDPGFKPSDDNKVYQHYFPCWNCDSIPTDNARQIHQQVVDPHRKKVAAELMEVNSAAADSRRWDGLPESLRTSLEASAEKHEYPSSAREVVP